MSETATDEATLHRSRTWKRRRNAVRVGTVLTGLGAVALVVLVAVGYQSARSMKGGATAEVITDPAAPGYVAAVDATPVHLLAITNEEDELSALVALVPAEAGGGSVVWSLGELIVQIDGEDTTLGDIYAGEGLGAARAEFEKLLGFGVTDAVVVGPDELAALAEPVAPLQVTNPDPVLEEQKNRRVERFEAGELSLDADEISEFLTIRGAGEAPENRATRAEATLLALADALAAEETAPPGSAVTSEAGADIASIIRTLGLGRTDFIVLPMKRQSFKGSYLYRPDADGIASELAGVVQFPISAFPGQRPRVRVLNGTPDPQLASVVAPDLAAAGGEVLLLGNADSLDAVTTTVVYSDATFEDVATRIATLLGVTAQLSPEASDAADIDVLLGSDYRP